MSTPAAEIQRRRDAAYDALVARQTEAARPPPPPVPVVHVRKPDTATRLRGKAHVARHARYVITQAELTARQTK